MERLRSAILRVIFNIFNYVLISDFNLISGTREEVEVASDGSSEVKIFD